MADFDVRGGWPTVPVAEWEATRDTLHMWTQIVGKIRMALMPMTNHWWQVPLYVNVRGMTTSLMPYRGGGVEIVFDFVTHALVIATTNGDTRSVRLEPRTVADFYGEVFARLRECGVDVEIYPRPVEVPISIPFAEDTQHHSYDPEYVDRFWHALVSMERVFTDFRARFVGKVSPVHFFWGSFDLAVTRFSGRDAPLHPGGAPNCPPRVMELAYSQEVSSCGYWPGGVGEGAFYSYAYPEPPGYSQRTVAPPSAGYDTTASEFLLPYADVRTAPDPDATLLSFLQTTYEAAADLAEWDREHLEEL